MSGTRPAMDEAHTRTIHWADVVRVLLRGAGFAALVTGVAVLTAILVTRASDPVYRTSVSMVVSQSAPRFPGLEVIAPPAVDPAVYRTALYEGDVLRRAFERVEGRPLSDLALERLIDTVRIAIETQELSSVVRIDVRNTSPEVAARTANAIAEELVAWDQQRARQGLSQGIAALERAIATIDSELMSDGDLSDERRATLTALRAERAEELDGARDASASAVTIGLIEPLREAVPPERPIGPRLVLNVAIAGLLGLVASYGVLLLGWTANPRVANRDDLERMTTLPVLAVFPTRRRGTLQLSEDASSLMRSRLSPHRTAGTALVVIIVGMRSTADQDGVAVGLAESFARIGETTLLVDADLRHARASAWLQVSATHATPYDEVDPTRRGKTAPQPVSIVVDADHTFDFLPAYASASQPVDRLVRVFRDHLTEWVAAYDVVVIDAAPIFPNPDVLAVARGATGVVLCARTGHTSRRDLEDAVELMTEQGVPLLGTVLTNAPRRSGGVSRAHEPLARAANGATVPHRGHSTTRRR